MGVLDLTELKSHRYVKYLWIYPKPALFFILWVNAGLFIIFRQDNVVEETITSMSETSTYVVSRIDLLENFQFDKAGQLGEFYNCLKNYKSIARRNVKGGGDGRTERVDLQIGKHTSIELLLSEGEAYQFTILQYTEFGRKTGVSLTYAINCQLSMLNK